MLDHKESKPVGSAGAFFMLAIAFFTDVFQLLLSSILIGALLNPIITAFMWAIFAMWLHTYGISMASGKRAFWGWTTVLVELIPLGNGIVFGWTAFIVYILVTNFKEHPRGV